MCGDNRVGHGGRCLDKVYVANERPRYSTPVHPSHGLPHLTTAACGMVQVQFK